MAVHVCNYPNLCPWKLALWWEALRPRGPLKVDLDGQTHNWEMTHGSIHFSWKIFLEIVSKLSCDEIPKKARRDFSFPPGYTGLPWEVRSGGGWAPLGTLQDDFLWRCFSLLCRWVSWACLGFPWKQEMLISWSNKSVDDIKMSSSETGRGCWVKAPCSWMLGCLELSLGWGGCSEVKGSVLTEEWCLRGTH